MTDTPPLSSPEPACDAADDGNDSSAFALERIRALLQPDRLGPDRRLPPERELSESLGVSRRAVRRALEVLSAEGRVWRRQGSGTYAGPGPSRPSLDLAGTATPQQVMEVRLRLEPATAALAAERATTADTERMRTLVQRLTLCRDSDECELWDSALHRTIAETAGNPLLLTLFELIDHLRQDPAWVEMRARARTPRLMASYSDQHAAIVEAIGTGDSLGAEQAMHRHLVTLQNNLNRMIRAAEGE